MSEHLRGKSPHDVLQWIHFGSNVATTLRKAYKFTDQIPTILTTATVEGSFSARRRIKTYFRSTLRQDEVSSHCCQQRRP